MPTALFVPETALLVPGVSGRTPVLGGLSTAALEAARQIVARGPAGVLVVGPARTDRVADAGRLCASLAAAGVPDRHVGWPAPCVLTGCPAHDDAAAPEDRAALATAVGLRLLAAAGWTGPTTVVELSPDGEPDVRLELGADDDVLVLGSLSARRDDSSPRAADPRALELDARLAADLREPHDDALARLRALDPSLAAELGVTGAAPWRFLARRLAGREVVAREVAGEVTLGMDYRVLTWRWTA